MIKNGFCLEVVHIFIYVNLKFAITFVIKYIYTELLGFKAGTLTISIYMNQLLVRCCFVIL